MKTMKMIFWSLLFPVLCMAQVPQGIKYQVVVRDAYGIPLENLAVGIRISLLEDSATGVAAYVETHAVMSNAMGLVNLVIGQGSVVSGNFEGLAWHSHEYHAKVEVDTAGGSNYALLGISQLLTVPYAFHAGTVSNVEDAVSRLFSYYYGDRDGDGYGDRYAALYAPDSIPGYVSNDLDCDDASASVTYFTYYRDADNDGFGDSTLPTIACTQPPGYVSNNSDCDDSDPHKYPLLYYRDLDGDGYGAGQGIWLCMPMTGYVLLNGDCNDGRTNAHPGAQEVCDGVDNDCDAEIDEECSLPNAVAACDHGLQQCLIVSCLPGWHDADGNPNNGCEYYCPSTLTDSRDGKQYPVVRIGSQCWMAKNLNVGSMINGSGDQTNNSTIEKYCFNNDANQCSTYGGLYQWNEMMGYTSTAGTQGICPTGWHIPTDAEWCTLATYLDPQVLCNYFAWSGTNAGGKMKATGTTYWNTPNGGATNSSGFTALGAGYRLSSGDIFYGLKTDATFWSSSASSATEGIYWSIFYTDAPVGRLNLNKTSGFSVRCLRN